jgi:CHAT domain-containing protein
LESWVTELREGLNIFEFKRRPDEKLFDLDLAHKLYKTLFENVPAAVKNKPRFIIHATGPLSTIPFHLLVEAQPRLEKATADPFVTYRQADWLVRHHAVSVIPSLSNLTTPVKKAKRKGKLFIGIGNPLLEGNAPAQVALATAARRIRTCAQTNSIQVAALPPVERGVAPLSYEDGYVDIAELRALAPLPETAQELCDAARSVGADASDILLGRQATETRLKALSESRELAEYGIVQFATHAALAGELEKSGEPGLVLTPPDKATDLDDGYLAASEVAGLNLDADWVILSACNTAGPEAEGAEGFSGLTRAFFHAGARSLLVSHWYVNSRSAARLTTLTLDALQKDPKIRRSEALRRAMLAHMADDSDPWNAHPAHWAPFVIVRAGKD